MVRRTTRERLTNEYRVIATDKNHNRTVIYLRSDSPAFAEQRAQRLLGYTVAITKITWTRRTNQSG